MKLRTSIGIVLASPATAASLLFYVLPMAALGWLKYDGWRGPTDKSSLGRAPCWHVDDSRAPAWLLRMWDGWGGHTVGTAVVLRYAPESARRMTTILNHELHHVHQLHTFGFLQVLMYLASTLCALAAGEDGYAANQFELAARKAAGQIVDPRSFFQGYGMGRQQAEKLSDDSRGHA